MNCYIKRERFIMSINTQKAIQAAKEMQEVINSSKGAVMIKKLKGLKKISIEDLYQAQSFAEAAMLGKQDRLEIPTGKVQQLLLKFNVLA